MFDAGYIPKVISGLIEGEIEGHRYFFNPRGHKGVLVLFGEALDVFNCCRDGLSLEEMKKSIPWADVGSDRVDKVIAALGKAELIDLGKEHSDKLRAERRRATKKIMTVWLQLTDACNLRCDYCCIAKKPTRMGLDMAKKLVDKVVSDSGRSGFEEVLFKLAGGEPTLFWADAKALIDWAEAHFADTKPKVRFHIITNGTLLTQSLVDYLKQGRVGISVSLDGVGKWHDIQRPYVSGGGSFEKVNANIDRLIAEGINFNILAVVTRKNAAGLTDFAEYCLRRNLPFRFGFYRDTPAYAGESEADNEVLIRELKKCYSWMAKNLPERSLQSLHKLADTKFNGPKIRNCGIGSSSITVGADGGVSICQYEMDVPLGNVLQADAILLITNQTHYDLASTRMDRVPGCQVCEWRYTCGGGCPLLTKQHFGRMGLPSPYCEVYRAILPELLELYARQLVMLFKKGGKL